jgi:hypothetical protein
MYPTTILTENKLIAVGQTRNIEYVLFQGYTAKGRQSKAKKKKLARRCTS